MNSLTLQDLVLLKQFLEKGVSTQIFTEHELTAVQVQLEKITNIINQVLDNL